MKKFLAMAAALAFVLTMGTAALSMTAFAAEVTEAEAVAEVGGKYYDTLIDAVKAAQTGETITLLTNYTVATGANATYLMPDNSILDLGGNTLTVPFLTAVFEGNNITIQNGRFESNADYAVWIGNGENETSATLKNISSNGGVNVFVASVVLQNCSIDASTKQYYAVWGDKGNVEVTIESGSYKGGTLGAVVNACGGSDESEPAKITIKGGNFTGEIWVADGNNGVNGQVVVYGGIYDVDPSEYVSGDSTFIKYTKEGDSVYAVGSSAKSLLANAEEGETFEIISAAGPIYVNYGATIENKTGGEITVNGKIVAANASFTAPFPVRDTVTIEIGGEKEDESEAASESEENPSTGAPVLMAVFLGAMAAAK